MRTPLRRTLSAAAVTGGLTVLGIALSTSPASAADDPSITSAVRGVLSGNQGDAGLHLPVKVNDQQVTVQGHGNSTAPSRPAPAAPAAPSSPSRGSSTSGDGGAGSGNQVTGNVRVPVEASGNQVTVIGDRNATRSPSGSASADDAPAPRPQKTDSAHGLLSGNQTGLGAAVPITVSGNQVTLIGSGNTAGNGGGNGTAGSTPATPTSPSTPASTNGSNGLGSGNQLDLGALLPIDLSGNQVTVIGSGNTSGNGGGNGTGTTAPATPASNGSTTGGANGLGSGNQLDLGALLPIDLSGNQVTVIGSGNNNAGGTTTGTTPTTPTTPDTTSGNGGTGSGNQIDLGTVLPVDVSGGQVTVIGNGNTNAGGTTTGTTPSTPTTPTTGDTTTGNGGTGSGNQIDLGAILPIDASGTQVTVIGSGNTAGNGGGNGTGTTAPATPASNGSTTGGANGLGSGNQIDLGAVLPIDLSGTQVTVIGNGNTNGGTTTGTTPSTPTTPTTGDTTSGNGGTGSGNQIDLGTVLPVDVSGGQVTVIGNGNTNGGTTGEIPGDGTGPVTPGDTGPTTPGDTGPTTPGDGSTTPGDGSTPENSTGNGTTGTGTGLVYDSLPQAGSGTVTGALPATGAASGLLPWAVLGFAILSVGLVLVGGARGRGVRRPRISLGRSMDA